MLTKKPRFETFEEYLNYEDNSEKLYELFKGKLREIPPESGLNFEIANFLNSLNLRLFASLCHLLY